VLLRERASGSYRLSAYFLSKTLTDFPFDEIFPFIFVTITYWMAGLRPTFPRYLVDLGLVMILNVVSSGFGLMISAAVTDARKAFTAATIILLAMMLSAGFFISVNKLPVWIRWTHYISYLKYGYDSLMLNEFDGNSYKTVPNVTTPYDVPGYSPLPGILIVDKFSIIIYSIGWNALILIGWAIFFRLVAYYFLNRTYRVHK